MTDLDRTPKPCLHPETTHDHGTRNCYTLDDCRCEPCCAARAKYQKSLLYRKVNGVTPYTDASDVRVHLAWLRMRGVGLRAIARASGIGRTALGNIASHRTERILKTTEKAVLGVDESAASDSSLVEAWPATRRLQALVCRGWSVDALCRRTGMNRQAIDPLLNGDRSTTLARRVQQVSVVYEQMWDAMPPIATPAQRAAVTRTVARALREGWVPPMAWDDIDDPEEDASCTVWTGEAATTGALG